MSAHSNIETESAFGVLAPQEALAAIRAENSRVGLSVSAADEIDMANILTSSVRHDMTNNRTVIVDGAGKARSKTQDGYTVDLTISDFIATIQKTVTPVVRTSQSPEQTHTAPAGSATARALAQNANRRAPAREASAADLVSEHGNPWHPRSINRTRQSLVTNLHPQLAATLRAQSGA